MCYHNVQIVIGTFMNHPRDYMPPYESESEEQTNSHLLQMRYEHTHYSHTHITSTSLLSPSSRVSHTRKKTAKSTLNKPKKPKNKSTKPKSSKKAPQEYLILGDSFYQGDNIKQLSQRLINGPIPVFTEGRWQRKERNCISKIEKYLRTFLVVASQRYLFKISRRQKEQLYLILKEQEEREQQLDFEKDMRVIINNLEQRTEHLISIDPQNASAIVKWKNIKLHQLMAARSMLSSQALHSINIFDLPQQIALLQEEKFFPQMKQEALTIQKQITRYLQRQAPQEREDEGVRWVLDRLFTYITNNAEQWERVAYRLEDYQNGIISQPLLSDRLYITFQKHEIGSSEREEKIFLHIFNRSIFDLINQNVSKVEMLYPAVECLKEIFMIAEGQIRREDSLQGEWQQDIFLIVSEVVFSEVLDQWLQEFLEFY